MFNRGLTFRICLNLKIQIKMACGYEQSVLKRNKNKNRLSIPQRCLMILALREMQNGLLSDISAIVRMPILNVTTDNKVCWGYSKEEPSFTDSLLKCGFWSSASGSHAWNENTLLKVSFPTIYILYFHLKMIGRRWIWNFSFFSPYLMYFLNYPRDDHMYFFINRLWSQKLLWKNSWENSKLISLPFFLHFHSEI